MPIVLAAGAGTPPVYVGLSAAGAVWRSSGGIDWEHAGDLKFPEGDANRVTTLVFDGDRFLAFGAEGSSAGSSISLAAYTPLGGVGWMSVDGSSWTASKLAAGIRVNRVDVVPGGFVGFGGAGEAPVAVSSRDGLAWTPHIVDTSGGFLPTDVIGLEDGGYLAAGVVTVGTCPDETGVRVWSSTDLDSWAPIPGADLGCGVMDRILRGPAGYLGLGHTLTPEISESLAWFSVDGRAWGPSTILGFNVLTGGIAPDGTFLALGEGIWEFTGGRDWAQSVNTGAFGVVAYAAGLAISCATPNDCRSWRIARVIPGG